LTYSIKIVQTTKSIDIEFKFQKSVNFQILKNRYKQNLVVYKVQFLKSHLESSQISISASNHSSHSALNKSKLTRDLMFSQWLSEFLQTSDKAQLWTNIPKIVLNVYQSRIDWTKFLWLGNFSLSIRLNQLISSLLDASLLPRLLHSMEEEFWQQKKTEYRESNILAKSNKELKWIGVWKWFNFFSPLFSLCSNEWRLLTFFVAIFCIKKLFSSMLKAINFVSCPAQRHIKVSFCWHYHYIEWILNLFFKAQFVFVA